MTKPTKMVDGVIVEMSDEEAAEWFASLPPPPVPEGLSFTQFIVGLTENGWITEAEGENWLDGQLPAPVTQLIATLPQAERFAARARAKRPSTVLRGDALVNALAASQGKTQAELDDFFRTFSGV